MRSATATPMITTTMVAMGGKVAKFSIMVETAMARPSPLRRFWTTTVLWSLGEITETSAAARTALTTARIAESIQKSQNGCGRALPARSMTAIARTRRGSSAPSEGGGGPSGLFGGAVDVVMGSGSLLGSADQWWRCGRGWGWGVRKSRTKSHRTSAASTVWVVYPPPL